MKRKHKDYPYDYERTNRIVAAVAELRTADLVECPRSSTYDACGGDCPVCRGRGFALRKVVKDMIERRDGYEL